MFTHNIAGMARGLLTFRQSDLERALRAVKKTGVGGRVEIDKKGSMVVHVAQSGEEPEADKDQGTNEWDAI